MSITEAPGSATGTYEHDEGRFDGAGAAMTTAAIFALVGILGFIPGVTKHIDFKAGERFSGPASHAMLFGLFQTSVLANLIFLAFGIVGAVSSFFAVTARLYFFVAAVIFGFFGIYGLAIDRTGPSNFLPVNLAGSWLHIGIAIVMLLVGSSLALRRSR